MRQLHTHLCYMKDVIFAANDEERNRKGTEQLSVLYKKITVKSGNMFFLTSALN